MISIHDRGAIRILSLNRPERRNALSTALMQSLEAALASAEADPAIGAVVLTGEPPAFCAGSDLKELGGLSIPDMCAHEALTAAIVRKIGLLAKPVVAAVEGYALGGGFVLAIACDHVVTAENAQWRLPEVSNGWLPPWGLQALVARVGPVKARCLTWGVTPILGDEALRLGVADEVAPVGKALEQAEATAQLLAALPREATASTKAFFAQFVGRDGEWLDTVASATFARDCASSAARETLARFAVRP